jgi:hypothetical protein
MGILTVANIVYFHDSDGWWQDANYSVGPKSREVIDYCNGIDYGRRLDTYLTEVATAFASLKSELLDSVALRDENYAQLGATTDTFIDFSKDENNLSVQTARDFRTVMPGGFAPSRKEELFLYLRFLESVSKNVAA